MVWNRARIRALPECCLEAQLMGRGKEIHQAPPHPPVWRWCLLQALPTHPFCSLGSLPFS